MACEHQTFKKPLADFCTIFLACLVSLVPFNQIHRLNLCIDTIQGSKRQVLCHLIFIFQLWWERGSESGASLFGVSSTRWTRYWQVGRNRGRIDWKTCSWPLYRVGFTLPPPPGKIGKRHLLVTWIVVSSLPRRLVEDTSGLCSGFPSYLGTHGSLDRFSRWTFHIYFLILEFILDTQEEERVRETDTDR